MYKKALSLLLALMLIVTSFSVAMFTVAATDDDEAASVLTVNATSNLFPDETKTTKFTQGEIDANNGNITVTYWIQSEEKLVNADWLLTYDGAVLEYDKEASESKSTVMPVVPSAVVNTNPTSVPYGIRGNCTELQPYDLCTKDGGRVALVTATFKVIGTGDTTVNLKVIDLNVTKLDEGQTMTDKEKETALINDGGNPAETVDFTASASVYAGLYDEGYVDPEPETTTESQPESTTEEPQPESTTEEPQPESTTEEPVADDVLIVAGSEAEIFGTGWDGTNEANKMTKSDDGTYTKDYTVSKAYSAVQLKSVKNGADWIGDKSGANVTFDLTGAGTFTVVYDPVDNYTYVKGDIVKEITEFKYDTVFAVGNGEGFWLNGASWDPAYAANEMNKVADDVWEIEFKDVPDGFERQIKFAIDGAWTHNFGGVFEDSGVVSAAAYNGDNITFDTDDTCTVKAQLDLRDFDFTTKEGAKFSITIDYGEPEPESTTEEPQPESTTEEPQPETTTEAPQPETTTEPAPVADGLYVHATSNFFPKSTAYYDDLTKYEDENGDVFITVDYKMNGDGKYIINIDVDELTWDPSVLEFKEAYNKIGTGRSAKFTIFPFAFEQGLGAGMVNTFGDNNGGRIVGNYTSVSPAAYAYEEDGSPVTVVRAVFKLIDKDAKDTTVNCKLDTLSLCDDSVEQPYSQYVPVSGRVTDEKVREEVGTYETGITPGEIVPEPETTEPESTTEEPQPESTTEAPQPESTTEEPQPESTTEEPQPESTTEEPQPESTTEGPQPESTTEAPQGDNLTVTGSSNYCASIDGQVVKTGDSVTVNFKAPETRDVVNIQWGMDYDTDLLQLTGISTIGPDKMLINTSAESYKVMGSFSDIETPVSVTEGDDFITFVFTAKGDGLTDVKLTVIDMTVLEDGDNTLIFENGVDKRQPEPEPETTTEEPEPESTTEEPEPESTTEEPQPESTTEEPQPESTTEEPQPESTTEEPQPESTTEEPEPESTTEEPEPESTTEEPQPESTTEAPQPESTTEAPVPGTTEQPGTASTDVTSVTDAPSTTNSSTSDSGSTPSDSGNNGAVQTGGVSMALIVLLVLVSGTAGIYFARKREEK